LINLDFADIRTVMSAKGMAIMGSGSARGENRAVEAATASISSPLLENISIDGATGIIINVTGGPDLSLYEVNEASTLITEAAHEDAEIIFGAVIDENMGDEVRVTVIATGFGLDPAQLHTQNHQHQMQALANQMRSSQQLNSMTMQQQQMQTPQVPVEFYPNVSHGLNPNSASQHFAQPPVQPQQFAQPQQPQFSMQQPMNQQFQQPPPVPTNFDYEVATPVAPIQAAQMQPLSETDLNLNGSFPAETVQSEKPLPRDVLLAKARQYRDTQALRQRQGTPEQLSMDVENGVGSLEMARRLANEIVKSPFDTKNLDVPAFLRRKGQRDEEDGVPLG
ncbi:MAG: cell division protein FtsZ, partial [Bdellovibrionota bacterium]